MQLQISPAVLMLACLTSITAAMRPEAPMSVGTEVASTTVVEGPEAPMSVSAEATEEGAVSKEGEASWAPKPTVVEHFSPPSTDGPSERFLLYYDAANKMKADLKADLKPEDEAASEDTAMEEAVVDEEVAARDYFLASRAAAASFYDIIDNAMVRDTPDANPRISEMEFQDIEGDDALASLLMLSETKRLPPLIVTHGGDTFVRHALTEAFINKLYKQQGLERPPGAVNILPGTPTYRGPVAHAGEGILSDAQLAALRPPRPVEFPEETLAKAQHDEEVAAKIATAQEDYRVAKEAYDAKVAAQVAATREAIRAHLDAHEMTVIHLKAAPEDLGAVLTEHPELKKKVLIVWVSPMSLLTHTPKPEFNLNFNSRQVPDTARMLLTDPDVRLLAINAGARWSPYGLRALMDSNLAVPPPAGLSVAWGPGIKNLDKVLDNDQPGGFFEALRINGRHFTDKMLPKLEKLVQKPPPDLDVALYTAMAKVFRERKQYEASSADLYLLPAVAPSLRQGSHMEHISVEFSLKHPKKPAELEGDAAAPAAADREAKKVEPRVMMQLAKGEPRKVVVTNFYTKPTYDALQNIINKEDQKQQKLMIGEGQKQRKNINEDEQMQQEGPQ